MATTETVIDKLIVGSKEKRIFGLVKIRDATFAAHTQATVKCGVNLDELTQEDVDITDNKISLVLPHVRVLDFSYPFQKFEEIPEFKQETMRNKFDILDYEEFYRKAEIDIRNHLEYMGLIEETEDKTRRMMTSLLKNLGYSEIYISFKKGKFVEKLNPNYDEYESN